MNHLAKFDVYCSIFSDKVINNYFELKHGIVAFTGINPRPKELPNELVDHMNWQILFNHCL